MYYKRVYGRSHDFANEKFKRKGKGNNLYSNSDKHLNCDSKVCECNVCFTIEFHCPCPLVPYHCINVVAHVVYSSMRSFSKAAAVSDSTKLRRRVTMCCDFKGRLKIC